MPFTAGTYTGLSNSFNNAVSGTVIDPVDWNELFSDIETAINDIAANGIPYAWDSGTTAADPGAGQVRANHATIASATELYISNTDGLASDISSVFATWGTGTTIILAKVGAGTTRLVFKLSTAAVAGAGFYTLTGTVLASGGTLAADDVLSLVVYSGSGATDVTATANFGTDNRVIRSDGTGKGVQASGITVDDTDNVTGMASLTLTNTGLHLLDTNASHDLIVAPGSNLTADRTLTITTGDANRTLTLPIPSTDVVWTPTGTGATASTAGAYFAREIWFEDYGGAVGNTGAQNSTAMTNFIARLVATQSIGRVGPGVFTFDDEITIVDNNVHIIGQGAKNSIFPSSGNQSGTAFKYAGATTSTKAVIRFAPTVASNAIQWGCRLEGIALNADAKAGIGIACGSTNGGTYRDVSAYGYTSSAMLWYAVATASATYSLNNTIENFWGVYGADGASGIVMIGPLSIANDGGRACAFNLFKNVHITHKDGYAFYMTDGDDNTFIECSASRAASGTGYGFWFGATAAQTGAAFGNRVYGFVCAATPTGTASPIRSAVDGAYAPMGNYIAFTAVDGNPVVTEDAGSVLWYHNLGGYTPSTQQAYAVQPATKFTTNIYTGGEPPVTAEIADTATNTTVYPLVNKHKTSGTATTSFGVGRKAVLENASGTDKDAGIELHYWVDATNASEDAGFSHYLLVAGSSTEVHRVSSPGYHYFPTLTTTASGANAFLNSGSSPANELQRSTSAARYKRGIEDMEDAYARRILEHGRVVYYKSAIPTDNQNYSHWGLVADELAKIDPRLVPHGYHDDDLEWVDVGASREQRVKPGVILKRGQRPRDDEMEWIDIPGRRERRPKVGAVKKPDGIFYDRLAAVNLKLLQMQDHEIADLKTRLARLEAAMKSG